MNKKFKFLLGIVTVGTVAIFGNNLSSTTVNASSKTTVKSTKNITHKQLTKKNDKGRVFDKIPVTNSKAKVKHQMKNYKDSTWIATKEAKLNNGNTYYYVTSTGGGNYGWVWSGYMKTSPKYSITKITDLKETQTYATNTKGGDIWDMPFGTKVKAKKIASFKNSKYKSQYYTRKKEMTLKSGVKYYYIESLDGKTKGWTWGGYLRKATYNSIEKNDYTENLLSSNGRKANGGELWDKIPGQDPFAKRKVISNDTTRTFISTRNVTLSNGSRYFEVTSTDGKIKGWVWDGYMTESQMSFTETSIYPKDITNPDYKLVRKENEPKEKPENGYSDTIQTLQFVKNSKITDKSKGGIFSSIPQSSLNSKKVGDIHELALNTVMTAERKAVRKNGDVYLYVTTSDGIKGWIWAGKEEVGNENIVSEINGYVQNYGFYMDKMIALEKEIIEKEEEVKDIEDNIGNIEDEIKDTEENYPSFPEIGDAEKDKDIIDDILPEYNPGDDIINNTENKDKSMEEIDRLLKEYNLKFIEKLSGLNNQLTEEQLKDFEKGVLNLGKILEDINLKLDELKSEDYSEEDYIKYNQLKQDLDKASEELSTALQELGELKNERDNQGNKPVESLTREQYEKEVEKELFLLINNYRKSNGLKVGIKSTILDSASKIRAKELDVVYSHDRPNGKQAKTAIEYNGSDMEEAYKYNKVLENITASYYGSNFDVKGAKETARIALESWINSPGHNGTLLRADNRVDYLSVGAYVVDNGLVYVQMFL